MSAERGELLRVGGDEMRLRLTSDETRGEAIAFEVEMQPGGGPPALHRHPSLEIYRVESGELCLYLGADDGSVERRVVGAGEVAFIPGGREHTIRNESGSPAEAFVVLSPGGELEEFARSASELVAPRPEEVMTLAARSGIEITRPLGAEAADRKAVGARRYSAIS